MTDQFTYKNGVLCAEDVALTAIAEKVGTPFYVYSSASFLGQLSALQQAFADLDPLIAYAMKANSNQAILTMLAKNGAGADVVSLGELERAIAAGIAPEKIVFSGVAKSETEIRRGLGLGIHCFNVESRPELDRLEKIAAELGKIAPVSLRINPDVDAKTHAKISTGKSENKFGIAYEEAEDVYQRIAASEHLDARGVDMHIGSQLIELDPFSAAFARLSELVTKLQANGIAIEHVDIGGGLGIRYDEHTQGPSLETYAGIVRRHIVPLGCKLVLEPGRWLAGNAGVMVTKVEYLKRGDVRNFVIVDAGMNDLIRPTLYEAHHDILPVNETQSGQTLTADVVGPICESSDYFAKQRALPELSQGDLIAVMSAGAYGAVMAGTYNSRPLIAEVLVNGDRFDVIRKRETVNDLIARDTVPDWI